MNKIHFDKVDNLIGFAINSAKRGEKVEVLTKVLLTSDDPNFYLCIEGISKIFLKGISTETIYKFLVIIHHDLSADVYINNFKIIAEMYPKRNFQKGEVVYLKDIADIRNIKFDDSEIKILPTDKIIFCFRVGWKFGLFFDLDRNNNLDLKKMYIELGSLYRYLLFQEVYDSISGEKNFSKMMNDGWFPFIELISMGDYEMLNNIYQSNVTEDKIQRFIDRFNENRIKEISDKWWNNLIFKSKQQLLEAGINSFLNGNYVACIKTLYSEIDGIIRIGYSKEENENNKKITYRDLLEYILNKAEKKFNNRTSLLLPYEFFNYLKDVAFSNFDIEKGEIPPSRHSFLHGVAKPEQYNKITAIQAILILDQIYFYLL
jgi:hypothetical protein